jgi:hypothetical protein
MNTRNADCYIGALGHGVLESDGMAIGIQIDILPRNAILRISALFHSSTYVSSTCISPSADF